MTKIEKREAALRLVNAELSDATYMFGPFNSAHEGYAVIKEELDELWDKIKNNESPEELAKEAKQVAAMGIRFLIDICSERL